MQSEKRIEFDNWAAAMKYLNQGYHLSLTNLSLLPPEIGKFKNLGILSLTGGTLSSLPKEISRLTHLREINLSDNNFIQIPPCMITLSNLEVIKLSGNALMNLQ